MAALVASQTFERTVMIHENYELHALEELINNILVSVDKQHAHGQTDLQSELRDAQSPLSCS